MPTYRYREPGHAQSLQATDLESAQAEAQALLEGGCYDEIDKTVYPEGRVEMWDADRVEWAEVVRVEARFDPPEPRCTEDEHDWRRPWAVVGGNEENPGVWGHGRGILIREVCAHCGAYRITNTRDEEEGGSKTLYYEKTDTRSLGWIRSIAEAEAFDGHAGP